MLVCVCVCVRYHIGAHDKKPFFLFFFCKSIFILFVLLMDNWKYHITMIFSILIHLKMLYYGMCCCVELLSWVWVFCDPMDHSPPSSSVCGDPPGKNTGVGCHALPSSRGQTRDQTLGLPHCRQIFYCLSHQGSPRILEWVSHPFSRGSSQPRSWTGISWASLIAQLVKNLPAMQETLVQFLGWEDPLEKG